MSNWRQNPPRLPKHLNGSGRWPHPIRVLSYRRKTRNTSSKMRAISLTGRKARRKCRRGQRERMRRRRKAAATISSSMPLRVPNKPLRRSHFLTSGRMKNLTMK